nr:hypothetical protein [Deltaproteobacteria bacterium]
MFARARSLAGTGSLSRRALWRARWSAGRWLATRAEPASGRSTYLRLYPAGNQVRTVRRSGGLE